MVRTDVGEVSLTSHQWINSRLPECLFHVYDCTLSIAGEGLNLPHTFGPLCRSGLRNSSKWVQDSGQSIYSHSAPPKSDQITAGAALHRLATTKSTGEQTEFKKRSWEWDLPHEWHHLLHDVFAEGDDDKEFLWEEEAALVLGNQKTTEKRKVAAKYSRRSVDIRSSTNSYSRLTLLYNQLEKILEHICNSCVFLWSWNWSAIKQYDTQASWTQSDRIWQETPHQYKKKPGDTQSPWETSMSA